MKLLKQSVSVALTLLMLVSFFSIAFAAETITVDRVTIQEYEDEFGNVDEDLATIVVEFTITNASEQMTLLLTSENITEISDEVLSFKNPINKILIEMIDNVIVLK